jgi:hypothetical protein
LVGPDFIKRGMEGEERARFLTGETLVIKGGIKGGLRHRSLRLISYACSAAIFGVWTTWTGCLKVGAWVRRRAPQCKGDRSILLFKFTRKRATRHGKMIRQYMR